jgi:site-specific recombinase XerD
MKFYLGTHQPSWLARDLGVPFLVSHRRLAGRRSLPRASSSWALDSGGFTELSLHGRWRTDAATYVKAVRRYATEIGNLDWAAPRDRMTEDHVLARTGLSLRTHQHLTVVDYLRLRDLDPELPFIPVLQGQSVTDYHRCADMYEQRGIDLAALPLVGVGSVCRRSRGFIRVSRLDGVSDGWECLSAPCLVVDIGMGAMILTTFSASGWQSWHVSRKPLIRERMPVLIDDDLRFEDDDGTQRPAVAVNRWLQELPVSGAPAERTWRVYADVLRSWMEFLDDVGVGVFGRRQELRSALGAYAGYRLCSGPLAARWEPSTWNLHTNVLGGFYRWAHAEGHAAAEPFTYATARRVAEGVVWEYRRNLAKVRAPKPHTTIKYLEAEFVTLFVRALGGLRPDGAADDSFRGRYLGRNAAMGELVAASGLRRREFTHLLVYEVPGLPARRSGVPVLFPVGHGVAKGSKQRTSWIDYDVLARVHDYINLERAAAAHGSGWRPLTGEPLVVTEPDWEGGRINGVRRAWRTLTAAERLRLVASEGESCLLAVQADGSPFVDWPTVFRRTSRRVRERFEPRFPLVHPHRLRHSFAIHTLEKLVSGYYRQAAALVADAGADAGLALYLTKADPLAVLRDLLGHSSVTTTELYLRRLDVTRVYRTAYEHAGQQAGLVPAGITAEVEAEFAGEAEV